MVGDMRESSEIIKVMDRAYYIYQMVLDMRENSEMINSMDRAYSIK